MKISFKNYPIDIILCMLWSLILLPISLLNVEGIIRAILGFPFILFIPGYVLIFAFFPVRKTDGGIDIIERIALSFGLSLAIVSLIGLGLNYTPWGIRLESILLSIFLFVISIGFIALNRWMKISPDKRFTISLSLPLSKSKNNLDYMLNIILVLSIIIAIALSAYIITTPKTSEKFTEFFILSEDYGIRGYPQYLTAGVNNTVILGILNHEYKTVNYTIEIWLINQSTNYNESEKMEKTIIHNMWFVDQITTSLEHTNIDFENLGPSQQEYNYSFAINNIGSFKLAFLLFTTPTDEYTVDEDYKDIAEQKISDAYRELHLWIRVYYKTPPKANFTYLPDEPTLMDTIYFTSNTTSPDGRLVRWKWDFGDGNTSYGETIGLGFDGIDDYVDCGNNASLQPVNGTVEAWIYTKEYGERGRIFMGSHKESNRKHPNFRLTNNNLTLGLTNNNNSEVHTCNVKFQPEKWYHVAAAWDGLNVIFYVNGSLKKTDGQNLTPVGNNDSKRIGGSRGFVKYVPPDFFNGTLKDVKIYNRALNSAEIQNNYNGNVTTNGLVSWWKMNETGNIAYDRIGNYNGTIYGADWINQARHKYNQTGIYQVRLTITNEYGQIHSISKYITIS